MKWLKCLVAIAWIAALATVVYLTWTTFSILAQVVVVEPILRLFDVR